MCIYIYIHTYNIYTYIYIHIKYICYIVRPSRRLPATAERAAVARRELQPRPLTIRCSMTESPERDGTVSFQIMIIIIMIIIMIIIILILIIVIKAPCPIIIIIIIFNTIPTVSFENLMFVFAA